MSSYSRIQLEEWLKTIDVSGKVLDVGGAQKSIKGRTKSWDVEEYKILDLEVPHVCKREVNITCDLNEQIFECVYDCERFDVAFCIEVSEYWYNPLIALENIGKFLKKGGLLYISFHFVYPVHNPTQEDYLRYTPEGAKRLLLKAGFQLEEVTPRRFKNLNDYYEVIRGEGMRPAKDYPYHDWQGVLIKAKKI